MSGSTSRDDTSRPEGIASSRAYLPELEGLRGVAVLLVLLYHLDALVGFPFFNSVGHWPSLPMAFVYSGHTGVSLFFVLSAFLLSLPFLDEASGGARVSRSEFYRRRALRILPLYWALVLVAVAVGLAVHAPGTIRRGLAQMLFVTSVSLGWELPPFTGVLWSLSTEVQFYLLLPLLPLALRRPSRCLLVLAAATLLYAALVTGHLQRIVGDDWALRRSIVGRWPVLAAGIAAAWLWRQRREALARALRPPFGDLLLLATLAALGALIRPVSFVGYHVLDRTWQHAWHVVEGGLWALVVLLVLTGARGAGRVLRHRVLVWLGVVSYSIYLVHVPVLHYWIELSRAVARVEPGWHAAQIPWSLGGVALVLVTAAGTYRWIERPFLRRKVRRADHAAQPSPAHVGALGGR